MRWQMLRTALRKSRQCFEVGKVASSPPEDRATEASITNRREVLAAIISVCVVELLPHQDNGFQLPELRLRNLPANFQKRQRHQGPHYE